MAKAKQLAADLAKPSPLEYHALKLLAKDAEKLRDQLTAGQGQEIDFTVHITGSIGVGEDNQYDASESPKLIDVLAILLGKAGEQRRQTITDILETAYRDGQRTVPTEEAVQAAEAVILRCTHNTTKTRRGNVTGSLKIQKLAAR